MKKLLSLILCVMMLFSVAACGKPNDSGTGETTATTDVTQGGSTAGTSGVQQTTQATQKTQATTTTPTTQATTSTPIVPTGIFDEDNIVLSFGALSDIHITGSGNNDANNKFRAALDQLKAQAAKHDKNGLDAIAIAGDIADTGKKVQVDTFTQIVKDSGIENVMLVTGNHDFYGDKDATLADYLESMGEAYFTNDIDKTMFDKGARHCVVGGYHFFYIEPIGYKDNCPYDTDVLKWLDNSLKEVTTANPNAYVFVVTHPMPYNTCYGSDLSGGLWYTTYLTETLSKYPQVVTFGGHLHFPVNDERTIMQTAFTSLGCGSVRYLAIERGYSNMASATVPKDAHSVSSGLLVQVDASGNLRVTRMDFSNESTFKTPWEIKAPTADGSHLETYRHDRKDKNQAPTLTGTPVFNINVSTTTGVVSGASITVPAGADDDFVHHYKVTVKNHTSGQGNTYLFLSDFYRHSQVSGMAKTLTFPLDNITEEGTYTIDVTAIDSWDAESGKISCTATVGKGGEDLSEELPEVYDDLDFSGTAIVSTKGKFTASLMGGASIASESFTFAGKTKTLSALNVSAKGQYGLVKFKEYTAKTLTDFYNSAEGFTVEAMFINKAPDGSQGIVCGTQGPGGWGIAQDAGKPYFFTYVEGGNIKVLIEKTPSETELTHIICTTLYNSTKNTTYTAVYINGELAGSGSKTGKVAVHSSENVATAFCLGADISSTGIGSDFPMTNFRLTDVKIYASALNFKQAETAYANAVAAFGG